MLTLPGKCLGRFVAGCCVAVLLGLPSVVGAAVIELSPGQPWPELQVGANVRLLPGSYQGPWEITVPGVTVEAYGATLLGPESGSTLIMAAEGIAVAGLAVVGSGPSDDLYTPDAAFWLIDCDNCLLTQVSASGARSAVRVEVSSGVEVREGSFNGEPGSPAVTAYNAHGLTLADSSITGFLDGVYVERSDDVLVTSNTITGAARYALHAMFNARTSLVANEVRGGSVGSAAMYGRDLLVAENTFSQHVGPLAFGLLLQELEGAVVTGNRFEHNTVGMLVVSAPDIELNGNYVWGNGFGVLVQRTPAAGASGVKLAGNYFASNVTDLAVDDPAAALALSGNFFESASRLDTDRNGVSDVPHVPSSSFDILASRQPDLSLFALSPGIVLWQSAEASVPSLRLASLADPLPSLALASAFAEDAARSRGPYASWLFLAAVVAVAAAALGRGRRGHA